MKKVLIFTSLLALMNAPAYSVKFINNSDSTINKIFYVEKDNVRHSLPINHILPGTTGEISMQGLFDDIIHHLQQHPNEANEKVAIRVVVQHGTRTEIRSCPYIILTAETNYETLDREKTFTFAGKATKWDSNVICTEN
jgi:hypothetical protein